ncbi:ATP-binding protein [Streptomyces sp. NPDC050504]|uniref:ATP-binding protein n=1 Tax=Streptomyces sp. NPDC050504 TaxID=3365618 RepID=UPI00379091F0
MHPSSRPTALVLLISAAVTGLLCLWAAVAAPDTAWAVGAAAVAVTSAVTLAAHHRSRAQALRAANAELTRRVEHQHAELTARAQAQYAEVTARAEARVADVTARSEARVADVTGRAEARVADVSARAEARDAELTARTRALAADVERLSAAAAGSESARAAAVSACANAAGRMQALATSMLADLREMEHRHADEDVLGDLLHLDHRTAQAGRLADSIAVLTGARSGRRWAKPIVMESILRGAMGRIAGYQRIRIHSASDIAIAGHAAEGVMHALAELLDNAANFSPPTAEVHVYVEEVPAGVVLTVEDSGLVMSDVQLRRAERAVCAESTDLTALSGTRLGLAVVGRLARKHGLKVSFRPSARGGTGALLLVPQPLITRAPRATAPAPAAIPAAPVPPAIPAAPAAPVQAAPAPAPVAQAPVAPAPRPEPEPEHASGSERAPLSGASDTSGTLPVIGDSGLPKRRRGRTLAAAEARAAAHAEPQRRSASDDAENARTQALRFSSFRDAVRAASEAPAAEAPGTDASATNAPGTVAPSTDAPGTDAREAGAPGTVAPSTNAPSTVARAAGAPGASGADAASAQAPAQAPTQAPNGAPAAPAPEAPQPSPTPTSEAPTASPSPEGNPAA